LEIIQAKNKFNDKLKKYGADCLFIAKGTFLDLELEKNKTYPWQLIYKDNTAVIYEYEKKN